MFSDLNEQELTRAREKAAETDDKDTLAALDAEAALRINRFLNDEIDMDSDDSPAFLSFLQTFSQTADVDLKILTKRAEVKLTPLLKEFDEETGLDGQDLVPADVIERNLTDIDEFEKIDLKNNPDFRQIYKILENTDVVDDDGNVDESADLAADMEKAAKLKTCLQLCLNLDKLTPNAYLSTLRMVFESLIVTLFVMDAASDEPDEEGIRKKFESLLDAIDE